MAYLQTLNWKLFIYITSFVGIPRLYNICYKIIGWVIRPSLSKSDVNLELSWFYPALIVRRLLTGYLHSSLCVFFVAAPR